MPIAGRNSHTYKEIIVSDNNKLITSNKIDNYRESVEFH